MLHDFRLRGERVRFWQKSGESYEHILMKALGYALFVGRFPHVEIEVRVGLRYKPDLVARRADGTFEFWGEAGENAVHKTLWLLKHAHVEKLVLFKIMRNSAVLIKQLRGEIAERYRAGGKLSVINFVPDIVTLTADKNISEVRNEWFEEIII